MISFSSLSKKQKNWISQGRCIDCGGQLLAGPSGGASQNAMCEGCREEFNIMGGFGFDRMGKNPQRALSVYGLTENPIKVDLWLAQNNQKSSPRKSFWRRLFG